MANSAFASRDNDPKLDDNHLASDPFATPTFDAADLPKIPEPAAQLPATVPRHQSTTHYYTHPTALHGDAKEEKAVCPPKSESMSSTGGTPDMTRISSINLKRSSRSESAQRKQRSRTRCSRQPDIQDPEKSEAWTSRDRASRGEAHRIAYLEDDDQDDVRQLQEEKAVKILLFLSAPCVMLSFLNAIWTLISLIITSFAQPVRLCARRPTFGQQLCGLLVPALNVQLRSIHTPPPHADEDTSYRPGMLLAVHLLSPFLSLGMMLAAWVVAVFWLSSAVVGDPSGTDRRDDGRETVLALRSWWESWLLRSVKDD